MKKDLRPNHHQTVKAYIFNRCGFDDCRHEWRPRTKQGSPKCPKCLRRGWEDGVIPPRPAMSPSRYLPPPAVRKATVLTGSELLRKLLDEEKEQSVHAELSA